LSRETIEIEGGRKLYRYTFDLDVEGLREADGTEGNLLHAPDEERDRPAS